MLNSCYIVHMGGGGHFLRGSMSNLYFLHFLSRHVQVIIFLKSYKLSFRRVGSGHGGSKKSLSLFVCASGLTAILLTALRSNNFQTFDKVCSVFNKHELFNYDVKSWEYKLHQSWLFILCSWESYRPNP